MSLATVVIAMSFNQNVPMVTWMKHNEEAT